MYDLKITGGTVVDGSGTPGRVADVGIRADRVVDIGPNLGAARESIAADGRIVAPGFVDVHTHYDAQVFWDSSLSPSCYHGVTTIIGGNCGFSIAPLNAEAGSYLLPMLARVEGMPQSTLRAGVPWDWHSFGEYLARIERRLAVNAGFMVGHSALRRVVMGPRATGEKATPQDMEQMIALLRRSLSEGGLGFSTTVSVSHNDAQGQPVPSRFATREELLTLAAIVKEFEGTTLELLPNLSFDQATIELLTDFSLAGQRPVNWNVLSLGGTDAQSVALVNRQLSATDYARARGAEVIALTFAGPATVRVNLLSGFIFDALNDWAPLFRLSPPERMQRLRDATYRASLEDSARRTEGPIGRFARWEVFRVVEVHSAANRSYVGREVGEIAQQQGKRPFDVMIDLALADGLKTSFMPPPGGTDAASYRLRAKLWTDDRTVVGASDAGAHMDMIDTFAFTTQLLAKSRELELLTVEEGVRQLTSVPARMVGLRERGELRPGWKADVVVFDPESVACGPTYTRFDLPGTTEGRLYADAVGISEVIVNGQRIVKGGTLTEARPGTVLRSGRDTYTVKLGARTSEEEEHVRGQR
jgi:N-acyl-D-aspartate/D-glutamate deacylase